MFTKAVVHKLNQVVLFLKETTSNDASTNTVPRFFHDEEDPVTIIELFKQDTLFLWVKKQQTTFIGI